MKKVLFTLFILASFQQMQAQEIKNDGLDKKNRSFYFPLEVTGGITGEIVWFLIIKDTEERFDSWTGTVLMLTTINITSYGGIYAIDKIFSLKSNPIGAIIFGLPANIIFILEMTGWGLAKSEGVALSSWQKIRPFLWIPLFQAIGNRSTLFKRTKGKGSPTSSQITRILNPKVKISNNEIGFSITVRF